MAEILHISEDLAILKGNIVLKKLFRLGIATPWGFCWFWNFFFNLSFNISNWNSEFTKHTCILLR